MKKLLLVVCTIFMTLTAAAQDHKDLTRKEAIALAKQACIDAGTYEAWFEDTSVSTMKDDDGVWYVTFDPKPGDSGIVVIGADLSGVIPLTGKAFCMGGL